LIDFAEIGSGSRVKNACQEQPRFPRQFAWLQNAICPALHQTDLPLRTFFLDFEMQA
jgi:hypothetical protein